MTSSLYSVSAMTFVVNPQYLLLVLTQLGTETTSYPSNSNPNNELIMCDLLCCL